MSICLMHSPTLGSGGAACKSWVLCEEKAVVGGPAHGREEARYRSAMRDTSVFSARFWIPIADPTFDIGFTGAPTSCTGSGRAHRPASVVCSSHDFHKTPSKVSWPPGWWARKRRGRLAQPRMPQSRADVLEPLSATAEMTDHHPRNACRHFGEQGALDEPPAAEASAYSAARPRQLTASASARGGAGWVNAVLGP